MTWIVGTVSLFGHSILISDIRVTIGKTEIDCLQKIAPLGKGFICGFAGSVRIGFAIRNVLAAQLPKKRHLPLSLLADDWIPSLARSVFEVHDAAERNLGCQLLIGAIHPTETLGAWPGHRAFVWKFSWDNYFLPQKLTNIAMEEPLSIGNGSAVPAYLAAVKADHALITFGNNRSFGIKTAMAMHKAVASKGTKGVSAYMQFGVASFGRTDFDNCNFRQWDGDGNETKVEVPRVATTYREFCDYCNNKGWTSAGAIC
jgi:hypothetical protein